MRNGSIKGAVAAEGSNFGDTDSIGAISVAFESFVNNGARDGNAKCLLIKLLCKGQAGLDEMLAQQGAPSLLEAAASASLELGIAPFFYDFLGRLDPLGTRLLNWR